VPRVRQLYRPVPGDRLALGDATCGFASAERPVMPSDPRRRPALLLVRALGPLDSDDRKEIARRLEQHQRLLQHVLPELRERLTQAEGMRSGC
jgi:hypothetical protein